MTFATASMPPELEVIASVLEGLDCKITNNIPNTKVYDLIFLLFGRCKGIKSAPGIVIRRLTF